MSVLDANPEVKDALDRGDVRRALALPLKPPQDLRALLGGWSPEAAGDGVYGAATLGDLLYDCLRIDPVVVEAVDFASSHEVGSVLSFAHWAHSIGRYDPHALSGEVSRISGYVGERLAARHLQALGHEVSFPRTANQEGWDLLVDGRPFQVKVLEGPAGVREHLERFRYPVIVNRELEGAFASDARVYVDEGLSHRQVRRMTERALEHGRDASDFEIPWISLAAAVTVEAVRLARGESDVFASASRALTGTIGGTVGGYAGSAAGSAALAMVFGPAGWVVGGLLGSIGGGIAGRRAAGRLRVALTTSAAAAETNERVGEVAAAAMAASDAAVTAVAEKQGELERALAGAGPRAEVRSYVRKRLEESRRYLEARYAEIERLAADDRGRADERARRLMLLLAKAHVHPDVVREPMAGLLDAVRNLEAQARRFV